VVRSLTENVESSSQSDAVDGTSGCPQWVLGTACVELHAQQQRQISSYERELAEAMLSKVHDALKTNYYDPSFQGIDIDAGFR
jgi:hypothetical protein